MRCYLAVSHFPLVWGRTGGGVKSLQAVCKKTGLTKKDATAALDAFTSCVEDALKAGDKISLIGFGTFEVKDRPARVGHNPRTNEEVQIPASKAPVFKAGKGLKDAVK